MAGRAVCVPILDPEYGWRATLILLDREDSSRSSRNEGENVKYNESRLQAPVDLYMMDEWCSNERQMV